MQEDAIAIPNADDHVPLLQLMQATAAEAAMALDHNPALHGLHCEAKDAPVVADQVPALQFSQDDVIVFIHVPASQATPARH